MIRLRPTILCTILLATLTVSVAGAQEWKGTAETVDGVLHVKNPTAGILPAREVALEEIWRLGGYSDDENEFFGVITDIQVDEDRLFYLLDGQLSEVRVFGENGAWVRTIGREGEGPGEFRRPGSMVFMPDGNVGVMQMWPSKIVLLTREGAPGGDFPFDPEGAGFAGLSGAEAAGNRLSMVYSMSTPGEGKFERTSYLAHVGLDGKVLATLEQATSAMSYADSKSVERDWNDFSNCWAGSRDGRVFARRDFTRYEVAVWDPEGNLERVVTRDYPDHVRSDDEIETVKTRWARMIRRWVQNPRFEIEPNWNPIQNIYGRDDGSLWVRNSRAAQDPGDGVLTTFDVFDRDGRFVQELVLRGQFDPDNDGLFVDGDYVLVVTDLVSARQSQWSGGDGDDEVVDEAEPMEVICYRIETGVITSN